MDESKAIDAELRVNTILSFTYLEALLSGVALSSRSFLFLRDEDDETVQGKAKPVKSRLQLSQRSSWTPSMRRTSGILL
jgi:hypothetical protein